MDSVVVVCPVQGAVMMEGDDIIAGGVSTTALRGLPTPYPCNFEKNVFIPSKCNVYIATFPLKVCTYLNLMMEETKADLRHSPEQASRIFSQPSVV